MARVRPVYTSSRLMMRESSPGKTISTCPNSDPWLLWIVMAYTDSCSGSLAGATLRRPSPGAGKKTFNRLEASGAYIIGATLTKSVERTSGYGYGYEPYKYGAVGDEHHEILMIPHQTDA